MTMNNPEVRRDYMDALIFHSGQSIARDMDWMGNVIGANDTMLSSLLWRASANLKEYAKKFDPQPKGDT